jgi:hypothetical protein
MPFFEESIDPMVDYIKKNLFNINTPAKDAPWGPILPPENLIMEAMMALPRLSVTLPFQRVVRRDVRGVQCAARGARYYALRAACSVARGARGNAQ